MTTPNKLNEYNLAEEPGTRVARAPRLALPIPRSTGDGNVAASVKYCSRTGCGQRC